VNCCSLSCFGIVLVVLFLPVVCCGSSEALSLGMRDGLVIGSAVH